MTLIFTKCEKRKKKKKGGKRPEENVEDFQNLIHEFQSTPPWIMTSSVTKQGRDDLLLLHCIWLSPEIIG